MSKEEGEAPFPAWGEMGEDEGKNAGLDDAGSFSAGESYAACEVVMGTALNPCAECSHSCEREQEGDGLSSMSGGG